MNSKQQELMTKIKLQLVGMSLIAQDDHVLKAIADLTYLVGELDRDLSRIYYEQKPLIYLLED